MASLPELKQNYPDFSELLEIIKLGKLPPVTAADNGKTLGVKKEGDKYIFAPINV